MPNSLSIEQQRTLDPRDTFIRRHIGPRDHQVTTMLEACGYDTLDALINDTIPNSIRNQAPLGIGAPISEHEMLEEMLKISEQNQVWHNFIGQGYYGTVTPPVITRNILQNPLWYTPYTPYQAEISQGRLEALMNFQQMVIDLTGMELAGASLLDEATAAAEAAAMCFNETRGKKPVFIISAKTFPQTIAVTETRCLSLGIELQIVDDVFTAEIGENVCGVLIQNPDTNGNIHELSTLADKIHRAGGLLVVASDLLALALVKSPGSQGADIVLGNSQRFGVPMGFGGPHAAFFATRENLIRKMPGRIIGVSKDTQGNNAYRMTLQTREQHIRRDKATSNICTAQALLAIMAGFYAVYHGPNGIRAIAERTHSLADTTVAALGACGYNIINDNWFDTITIQVDDAEVIHQALAKAEINICRVSDNLVRISMDETTSRDEIFTLIQAFAAVAGKAAPVQNAEELDGLAERSATDVTTREVDFMQHDVFNTHHSETELMRYAHALITKDYSLVHGMIPLGSCTMKLNAAAEMLPITLHGLANMHPFCPADQAVGYHKLIAQLEDWLSRCTGFSAFSLQPNAGSQGEYAGLMVIRALFESKGEGHRNICLIPTSAHGTNPASANIAGMKIVAVKCLDNGELDLVDLREKAEAHKDNLAAMMITYPSTFGVFEDTVSEACEIIHDNGGRVYMDGANMNAQVGLTSPGFIGADVCHLNLHKTFCIPHGGGGPGIGPIGVTAELAPFLPGHPLAPTCGGSQACGTISAAPYGSPLILPITWAYIRLMGDEGLTKATKAAILNANYIASKLENDYNILYTGNNGTCAHEFILDVRPFQEAGVTVDDFAKRLMDYGFHAPTMSWPVPGTLMFEPTESEPLEELDRLIDAMQAIRAEITRIENGDWPQNDNPLHNAPHTQHMCMLGEWKHPYTREEAAYPIASLKTFKFWPTVGRVDNVYGDRNLMCSCPTVEEMCEV